MASGQTSVDYAGDLAASEAYSLLAREPSAQLVDVRTIPEWNFVGVPDLSAVGRKVQCIEWQMFPSMQVNPDFVMQARRSLGDPGDAPVLLLCRSGARSRAAAKALTAAGYGRAFNIADGFEGDLDGDGHRGRINGWKAAGLPWKQS